MIGLLCAFNSLVWIGRPFPGFFLWEDRFVPAVGDMDWTGYQAGLPYQSQLVEVEGEPVETTEDVYRAVRKVPIGAPVEYTFEVVNPPQRVSLSIPTMRFTLQEYLWTMGTYLFIGGLLTVLGFAVYLMRPDVPSARAMLYAGTTWGMYIVTSADILGPGWFHPLCLTLESFAPVTLVHIALTFPVQRRVLRQYPALLPSLYVAAGIIAVASNLAFDYWFAATWALNHLRAGAVIVAGLATVALLMQALLAPPSAAAQQRTKIAVLGAGFAFLSPVAGYLVFYLLSISIPFNMLAMPLAVFPIAIGYAIVKYNLFEVDAILRRAVSWALLSGVIAALYLGGVGTLEYLFAGRSGRVAQLFFLLSIVALFNPLRDRVQTAIDFVFARDRYDYRKTVAEASQALATLLNLEAVVGRILQTITQTIHVEFGAVWLRAEGGYRLQAVAGSPAAGNLPPYLDSTSRLVRRLEERPQRILVEDAVTARGTESEELARLGTRILVPMSFERRLVGFMALGPKESGRFYSTEDLELLRTLANQGAVAVENAKSYRALLRANEELRAAQSRLIEAERFAAIGELSAAVAHGIRNPLAGIKAAAQFADLDLPREHPLRENIVDIISEVDKLESRIKALLDFAKPFEPHPSPSDISRVINDAVTSLRSQINAQGIELTVDVAPGLPQAQFDYAQIEQVLLALLSNAVEAMPKGGQIAVRARLANGGHVAIEVADTGPGIPREQLPPVFKLFFTTKSSGTGLGLAVAKKIVELHGGTIAAESEVGRGSRFTVELPLAAPRLAATA